MSEQYIDDILSEEMIELVENTVKKVKDEEFAEMILTSLQSQEEAEKIVEYVDSHPNATPKDVVIYLCKIHRNMI